MKKRAILLVSFGSSYRAMREKTLDCLEKEIASTYPSCKVYTAFTSTRILETIKVAGEKQVNSVEGALQAMMEEGIEHVYIQPTFIIKGLQYQEMVEQVGCYSNAFHQVRIGNPLLTTIQDYKKVIATFTSTHHFPADEGVVCMGHGSEEAMSVSFAALDYMFKEEGYDQYYVATIKSYPSITQVVKQLKKKAYRKIHLYPFMLIAGYHAQMDMTGKAEKAWKTLLEKEGYEVESQLIGLGEYEGIRQLYIAHIAEMMKEDE